MATGQGSLFGAHSTGANGEGSGAGDRADGAGDGGRGAGKGVASPGPALPNVAALSETLIAACRDPQASAPLRAAARATAVAKFASRDGRAAWLTLLQELGLEIPAP